ncbi:MAG: helicase C-terminal domain-containing protein, partial [Ruthenibacterium sp.]
AALIGCVVVGVGLPQIGPEQDALRDYYEAVRGSGFAYAYQFPGMNKVLQAAGRVIRTKADRGLVLLIDSRYTRAEYRCLMPPHWSHMRYVSAPKQAQELVQAFWSEANKEETAL